MSTVLGPRRTRPTVACSPASAVQASLDHRRRYLRVDPVPGLKPRVGQRLRRVDIDTGANDIFRALLVGQARQGPPNGQVDQGKPANPPGQRRRRRPRPRPGGGGGRSLLSPRYSDSDEENDTAPSAPGVDTPAQPLAPRSQPHARPCKRDAFAALVNDTIFQTRKEYNKDFKHDYDRTTQGLAAAYRAMLEEEWRRKMLLRRPPRDEGPALPRPRQADDLAYALRRVMAKGQVDSFDFNPDGIKGKHRWRLIAMMATMECLQEVVDALMPDLVEMICVEEAQLALGESEAEVLQEIEEVLCKANPALKQMTQAELRDHLRLMGLDTTTTGHDGIRRRRMLLRKMHASLVHELMCDRGLGSHDHDANWDRIMRTGTARNLSSRGRGRDTGGIEDGGGGVNTTVAGRLAQLSKRRAGDQGGMVSSDHAKASLDEVSKTLSLAELREELRVRDVETSTPGQRGPARHEALRARLAEALEEEAAFFGGDGPIVAWVASRKVRGLKYGDALVEVVDPGGGGAAAAVSAESTPRSLLPPEDDLFGSPLLPSPP